MSNSDLSGKIVFKIKLDKEIKKIVIHNDDINYNELLLMMQRIFSEKIKPNDEFTIKYTDEENDLITLSNDSDVLLALQNSKILKLTIFLNEEKESPEEINHGEIAKELQHIRLSIDKFLERFEKSLKLNQTQLKNEEASQLTSDMKGLVLNNGSSSTIKKDLHIEFDPLNRSNDQSLKHLQKNSRAETPDSVTNELSPSVKKTNVNPNGSVAGDLQHNAFSNMNIGGPQPTQINQSLPPMQNPNLPHFSNQDHLQQHNQFSANQQFNSQQQPPFSQAQQPLQQQNFPQTNQQQYYQSSSNPNLKAPIAQHPQGSSGIGFMSTPQYPNSNSQAGLTQSTAPIDPKVQQQIMYQQQQQQPPQFYQQQQQQQPVSNLGGQQQPQQQSSLPGQMAPNFQAGPQTPTGLNPYSKPPTASIVRPPSATIYQQGYR